MNGYWSEVSLLTQLNITFKNKSTDTKQFWSSSFTQPKKCTWKTSK